MPALTRPAEGKTIDSHYLTVEQVRLAACAWLQTRALPPSARRMVYEQTADLIAYYQRRKQQARKSHAKSTRKRLRAIGIRIKQLRSCVPDET